MPAHDRLGLLVRLGGLAHERLDLLRLRLQVLLAHELRDHESEGDALLRLRPEHVERYLQVLRFDVRLLAKVRERPLAQQVRLALDQRLRHGEARLATQALQRLGLDRRVDLVLQLDPEVRLDFAAQVVDFAARDAERLHERRVEVGNVRRRDLADGERELRRLSRHLAAVVIGGKRERERLRRAGLHAGQRGVEFGEHPSLAEDDRKILRLAAGELDAVDRAGEIDRHPVALLRAARDGRVAGALAAQHVERAVDVLRRHLGARPRDRDAAHVAELDLGVDLENRGELQRVGRGPFRALLDARRAGDAQILRAHRVVEARPDALGNHVRAHLRAILLVEHAQRRLAGPEAGDLDGAREARQPLPDLALDLGDRHRDVQPAFERAERFNCVLHATGTLAVLKCASRALALNCGWCERGDSTPHGLPRQLLRLVRLPVPPLSRVPSIRCPGAGNKNARPGPGALRIGGPSRIRTLDLLIKSQLLYQLS